MLAAALVVLFQVAPAAGSPPLSGAAESVHFERMRVRHRVEADGTGERLAEMRAKVLDPLGVELLGQIAAPYMFGFSEVVLDSATLEKGDGRKISVDNTLVEDLNPFGTAVPGIPIDVRVKRFTVPGVEPGDTVHYFIRTIIRKPLFPGRLFDREETLATAYADLEEVELDRPAGLNLKVALDEPLGFKWEKVASAPADRIVQKAVRRRARAPAIGPDATSGQRNTEAETQALREGRNRLLEYSNFGSWDEVSTWWLDMSSSAFEPDGAIRAEVRRIIEGKTTTRAKAEALASFVAEKVRYLNVAFGEGRMKPRPANEVFSHRYGDCKDKFALLAAMAKAAGLVVFPALVQTGEQAIDEQIPSPSQFDHVIAAVQLSSNATDLLWIDPTVALGPPGFLAAALRDDKVLLIRRQASAFVRTPAILPYRTFLDVQIAGQIEADGKHVFTNTFTNRSDYEISLRASFRMLPKDRWDDMKTAVAPEWSQWKVSNVTPVSDLLRVDDPLAVRYDATWEGGSGLGKPWTLWLPTPELQFFEPEEKPRNGVIVRYPGSLEKSFAARIDLPPGVKARAPVSISLERPFATYRATYSVKGNVVSVERKLTVLRPSIMASEAASYNTFRDAILADGRQKFSMDALASPAANAQPSPSLDTAGALNERGLAAFNRWLTGVSTPLRINCALRRADDRAFLAGGGSRPMRWPPPPGRSPCSP